MLTGQVVDGQLFAATLVLEPKSGGDLQVHSGRGRIIEQWKAKGGGGTWSLKSVVEEVLPDLYRAVGDSRDPSDEFRFVTEGRPGRHWKEATKLFASLPAEISALDDTTLCFPLGGRRLSRRGLLDHIVSYVASLPVSDGQDRSVVQDRILHLLRHFRLVAEVSRSELERKIDDFLRPLAAYHEQIPGKRDQLCGSLLKRVADKGEIRLDPEAFLRDVGLNPTAVKKNFAHVKRELDEILLRRLRDGCGYEPASDVRPPLAWPATSPVLVLSGESGQGKSWQMASIGCHLSSEGELVLVLPWASSARADLQDLADLVFKDVLDFDQGNSFDRVLSYLRSVHGKVVGTPVVLIDGIEHKDHAEALILNDWRRWGVRAVLSVSSPAVAASLSRLHADRVHHHVVGDLSTPELRDLLRRRGRDLGVVPADLRATIARPLLASLYCSVSDDPAWNPATEYELYERFWEDRLRSVPSQAEFPRDEACLASLARSLLDTGAVYPWPAATAGSHDVDSAMAQRLERIGWLRQLARGDCEIWHSRLLNWAVAEGLYDKRRTGGMTTYELAQTLADIWKRDTLYSGQRLAYVPMDVIWLVCDPTAGLEAPEVADLLAILIEKTRPDRVFFSETLPTVGARILPALSRWLDSVPDLSAHPELAGIQKALLRLGTHDPTATRREAIRLLAHQDRSLQGSGCRVIARFPSAEALDPLWKLDLMLFEEADESKKRRQYILHEQIFEALSACLPSDPYWLRRRIQSANAATEPVDTLAYLLAQLQSSDAARIWEGTRDELIAKLRGPQIRALAYCIRRFGDRSLMPRVRDWLAGNDAALAATAVSVLGRLEPEEAVAAIKTVDPIVFGFFRDWWLPELLIRRPQDTLLAIEDRLRAEPRSPLRLADIVQGYEDLMSEGVVDALLDSLDLTIRFQDATNVPKDSDPVWYFLHLLRRISSPSLLCRFEARAGSRLEETLTDYLVSRLNLDRVAYDSVLENGIRVLLRINGTGIRRFVRAELGASSRYERSRGALLAGVAPSGETLDLLRGIAAIEAGSDDAFHEERRRALDALFGFGDVPSTIVAVVRWGLWAAQRAAWMRIGLRPFSDEELRRGLELASWEPDPITSKVLVVSISGRTEFSDRVRAHALDSSKETRCACLFALGELGDSSDEALMAMGKAIQEGTATVEALRALRRIGTPAAVETIVKVLAVLPENGHLGETDFEILGEALAVPEARRYVARRIWSHVQNGGSLWPHESYLEALRELDEPIVREYLWEAAFSDARVSHDGARKQAAIRALTRLDPVAAFSAFAQTVKDGTNDHAAAARDLLICDPSRAIPVLLEHVTDEPTAKIRWCYSRALRPQREHAFLETGLVLRLKNPVARVRSTAAEMVGWMGPGFLTKKLEELILEDPSVEVERVAVAALHRQEREKHTRSLLDEILRASEERRWALAECLVTLADPILLRTPGDPCSVDRLGIAISPLLHEYLNERIEQRKREVDDDARGADFAG